MKKNILSRIILTFVMCLLLANLSVTVTSAKSIQLSNKSITLRKGYTSKLKVKNTKKKVKWSSKNKKIATVSSKGKVTAKKAGSTTIYAKVAGKTLKCKVKVVNFRKFTYNGHKYQIINTGMTWSNAKKYCKSIGGHLATITSENEQLALTNALKKYSSFVRNSYWLGACKNSDGEMKWVTKEPFSYTDWAGGQPDHWDETALMIYTFDNPITSAIDTYHWNDLYSDGTFGTESWFGLKNFGFICEWE